MRMLCRVWFPTGGVICNYLSLCRFPPPSGAAVQGQAEAPHMGEEDGAEARGDPAEGVLSEVPQLGEAGVI